MRPRDVRDEHRAADELAEHFRRLGRERARGRRRRGRTAGLATVAAVLSASAVAGATGLFGGTGPEVETTPDLGPGLSRVPADERVAQATVVDPSGGLPWGVRVYTSRRAETCVVTGRVRDGRLGRLSDSRFRPLPAEQPGFCADLAEQGLVATVRVYGADYGERSVLYGIVDRSVVGVALRGPEGTSSVTVASDGTFIAVRKGLSAFAGTTLVADRGSGQTDLRLG